MKNTVDSLEDYFKLRGNPAATSHIAERMRELQPMYPELSFDELRSWRDSPGSFRRKSQLADHTGQLIDTKPRRKPGFKPDFDRERSGAIFGSGRKAVNH